MLKEKIRKEKKPNRCIRTFFLKRPPSASLSQETLKTYFVLEPHASYLSATFSKCEKELLKMNLAKGYIYY